MTMSKCKNCDAMLDNEEACIFAIYRTNIDGKEIIVCCENCAKQFVKEPLSKGKVIKKTVKKSG